MLHAIAKKVGRDARPRSDFEHVRPEIHSLEDPGHNVRLADMKITLALVLLVPVALAVDGDWSTYGGDAGGTRYSPLKQVTQTNVAGLRLTWSYHTGALEPRSALNEKAAFEATPILVDGVLYLSTPFNRVIALDPGSGAEKWTYDPDVDRSHGYSEVSSRGVAAWTDSKIADAAACKLRIFEGTIDGRLIALDGKTGKPCGDFGARGAVDLTRGVCSRRRVCAARFRFPATSAASTGAAPRGTRRATC
jgi:quinoprotein glucose dehydrogenase